MWKDRLTHSLTHLLTHTSNSFWISPSTIYLITQSLTHSQSLTHWRIQPYMFDHSFIQTHFYKNGHKEISWYEPLHSLRPVRQANKGLPPVSVILRSFQRLSRSIALLRAVDHPAFVTLCLSSPRQVSSNRLSFSAHWFRCINSGHAWPAEPQSTQHWPGLYECSSNTSTDLLKPQCCSPSCWNHDAWLQNELQARLR